MKKYYIYKKYRTSNRVTLYSSDCLTFLRSLPNKSVQLVITSPPYNIGKEYEKRIDLDVFVSFYFSVLEEFKRVLKDSGSICWQVGNFVNNSSKKSSIVPLDIKFFPIFENLGFKLRNRIIWHFGHGLHNKNRLSGRYETINWYTIGDDYIFNLDDVRTKQKYPGKRSYRGPNKGKPSGNKRGKNPSDFWDDIIIDEIQSDVWENIPNVKGNHSEKTIHPCQYPIALVRRLVRMLSNKNHLILDPFLGVGTTLLGALMEGRRAAGSEINDEYVTIARKRLRLLFSDNLKFREDKCIYVPNLKTKVTQVPQEWK